MRRKSNFLRVFRKFYSILGKKLSSQEALNEVKMMNFKIHPLSGNFDNSVFLNRDFIDLLWNLGKIEELFKQVFSELSPQDKRIFLKIFKNFSDILQKKFYFTDFSGGKISSQSSPVLEIEVFRENIRIKN